MLSLSKHEGRRCSGSQARHGENEEGDMANNTMERPVLTLSAGPVDAYPAVLRGLSSPIFYDFDPWFQGFYERVNEKATAALRSNRPAVILQGEPVLGLEAAAASLIS